MHGFSNIAYQGGFGRKAVAAANIPRSRMRVLLSYSRVRGIDERCCKRERRQIMNWDQIEGNWKQLKGKVKEKWGKLTDDELEELEGNRDQLVGKIQEQYGISKDEAEKQLRDWAGKQKIR